MVSGFKEKLAVFCLFVFFCKGLSGYLYFLALGIFRIK